MQRKHDKRTPGATIVLRDHVVLLDVDGTMIVNDRKLNFPKVNSSIPDALREHQITGRTFLFTSMSPSQAYDEMHDAIKVIYQNKVAHEREEEAKRKKGNKTPDAKADVIADLDYDSGSAVTVSRADVLKELHEKKFEDVAVITPADAMLSQPGDGYRKHVSEIYTQGTSIVQKYKQQKDFSEEGYTKADKELKELKTAVGLDKHQTEFWDQSEAAIKRALNLSEFNFIKFNNQKDKLEFEKMVLAAIIDYENIENKSVVARTKKREKGYKVDPEVLKHYFSEWFVSKKIEISESQLQYLVVKAAAKIPVYHRLHDKGIMTAVVCQSQPLSVLLFDDRPIFRKNFQYVAASSRIPASAVEVEKIESSSLTEEQAKRVYVEKITQHYKSVCADELIKLGQQLGYLVTEVGFEAINIRVAIARLIDNQKESEVMNDLKKKVKSDVFKKYSYLFDLAKHASVLLNANPKDLPAIGQFINLLNQLMNDPTIENREEFFRVFEKTHPCDEKLFKFIHKVVDRLEMLPATCEVPVTDEELYVLDVDDTLMRVSNTEEKDHSGASKTKEEVFYNDSFLEFLRGRRVSLNTRMSLETGHTLLALRMQLIQQLLLHGVKFEGLFAPSDFKFVSSSSSSLGLHVGDPYQLYMRPLEEAILHCKELFGVDDFSEQIQKINEIERNNTLYHALLTQFPDINDDTPLEMVIEKLEKYFKLDEKNNVYLNIDSYIEKHSFESNWDFSQTTNFKVPDLIKRLRQSGKEVEKLKDFSLFQASARTHQPLSDSERQSARDTYVQCMRVYNNANYAAEIYQMKKNQGTRARDAANKGDVLVAQIKQNIVSDGVTKRVIFVDETPSSRKDCVQSFNKLQEEKESGAERLSLLTMSPPLDKRFDQSTVDPSALDTRQLYVPMHEFSRKVKDFQEHLPKQIFNCIAEVLLDGNYLSILNDSKKQGVAMSLGGQAGDAVYNLPIQLVEIINMLLKINGTSETVSSNRALHEIQKKALELKANPVSNKHVNLLANALVKGLERLDQSHIACLNQVRVELENWKLLPESTPAAVAGGLFHHAKYEAKKKSGDVGDTNSRSSSPSRSPKG